MMARLHSLVRISYMTYLHEEDTLTLARFAGSHNEFSFNAIFGQLLQEIFIKTLFFWRKMSKRGGRCTHFSYFHLFLVVLNSIFLPVLGRGKVQHKGRRRHFTDAEELKAEMERDRQKNWRVNEADFLILLLWYFTHRGILRCFMLFIVSLRFRFYHIICMMQSNTFLKQGNSLFSSYWK